MGETDRQRGGRVCVCVWGGGGGGAGSNDAAARHLQQWRHQCAPTLVNQVIRHPRTTYGAVIVNVNKRSVSADART